MAPPRASKNFEQRQPITTTLRNICESYPPNTCLRELLQNADDARASEVEFVLDTRNHASNGPFLHDGLAQYAGPALLARNNSVFTEKDFGSLSSVGDSGKRNDPETIGKFGQGFNSVFHWTDGPQIYSGDTLLLLDPHHQWSQETDKPGGPAWAVVDNVESVEIQNHLRTFGSFHFDPRKLLNETFVRIPLRTPAQAESSRIKPHAPSNDEIKRVLEHFCEEIEGGGLLFLKHVKDLTVRIDDTLVLRAMILDEPHRNQQPRNAISESFRGLFTVESPSKQEVSLQFETKLQYTKGESTRTEQYVVQHLMAPSCGNAALDTWARGWKLFPWVAVAAPLTGQSQFSGHLFSNLSLPIQTRQPVHIHALFAIAPDRARLGLNDMAKSWNQYLFQHLVSAAWLRILEHRRGVSFREEKFSLWPAVQTSSPDLWSQLDNFLIDEAITCNSSIWNASTDRCVSLTEGFFLDEAAAEAVPVSALAKMKMSTVLLPADLMTKVTDRVNVQATNLLYLSPASARAFLRHKRMAASDEELCAILEYCLSDAISRNGSSPGKLSILGDLDGLFIWPTLDGTRSNAGGLLLPRDVTEMGLFRPARASLTVDFSKLSSRTQQFILRNISLLGRSMRHRELHDFAQDWPIIYQFSDGLNNGAATIGRNPGCDEILRNAWDWILKQNHLTLTSTVHDSILDQWLIPLRGLQIRRYSRPTTGPLTLIVRLEDTMGKVLSDLAAGSNKTAPMLDEQVLSSAVVQALCSNARKSGGFFCQDDIEELTTWLLAAKQSFPLISASDRQSLLDHLVHLCDVTPRFEQTRQELRARILRLPIFIKSCCATPFQKRKRLLGSLDDVGDIFSLPEAFPPMPDLTKLCLCDPSSHVERRLLSKLGVIEQFSLQKLLAAHVLPWLLSGQDSAKDLGQNMVQWIFTNSEQVTPSWVNNILYQIPVPTASRDSESMETFQSLRDVVDPQSAFAEMFFDDEIVFLDQHFQDQHRSVLDECKLSNGVSGDTPLTRARKFSGRGQDLEQLSTRVECLFRTPIDKSLWHQGKALREIRTLKWIPGLDTVGKPTLFSPTQCRPHDQSRLVDKVWGVTQFAVNEDWKKLLGWDQALPTDILLEQLDKCVRDGAKAHVDTILTYLKPQDISQLVSRPFILGSQGSFYRIKDVFSPGTHLKSHSLAPWLDFVDPSFARNHEQIIANLAIQREPSIDDLRRVQQHVVHNDDSTLDEGQLATIISTLEIAVRLESTPEDLSLLLVPNASSTLKPMSNLVYGDRSLTGDFDFTHPTVSEALIRKLGIESCLERAMRLEIEIDDGDEDEYVPRETLKTVITDTLSRYPIESTFNEYLANADDAHAKEISWILDPRRDYLPVEALFTKELATFQGPALFVHNDGVFTEDDLKGFQDIGQGGKKNDASSTGMFGRGALSMYHFTDVPMILSADFLLILDPQQQVLPRNRLLRRKVGVKQSLSRVRHIAPDQLAPFEGIKGFSKDLDHYDGTIFRFPLRRLEDVSLLKDRSEYLSAKQIFKHLQDYFDIAQSSLLFLSNVERISFSTCGNDTPEWSVTALKSEIASEDVYQKIIIKADQGLKYHTKAEWRVGITDVESSPAEIVKTGKGQDKATECGVAACLKIEEEKDTAVQSLLSKGSKTAGQIFCRLPTNIASTLPISFHGSFHVTGDRRTIPFLEEDTAAKWNRHLLKECISELYVEFLRDLAPLVGEDVFAYWPKLPSNNEQSLPAMLAASFWERIRSEDYASEKLFACLAESPDIQVGNRNDLRRSTPRKGRKLHPIASLQNAVFDFLDYSSSRILHPLFTLLGECIVRPSFDVRLGLNSRPNLVGLSQVDAQWVAKTFKKDTNATILDQFLVKMDYNKRIDVLAVIFKILEPLSAEKGAPDLKILNGCRLLPRPGLKLPLGTLRVVEANKKVASWHLAATAEERELFFFAHGEMIHLPLTFSKPKTSATVTKEAAEDTNLLTGVLEGPFNIREIGIEDVGRLLVAPDCPAQSQGGSTNQIDRDQWTQKLWEYLNAKFNHVDVLEQSEIRRTAICRYREGSQWRYMQPSDLDTTACIVEPQKGSHRQLCSRIPEIRRLDPDCLPLELVRAEQGLSRPLSFRRLLDAFNTLNRQTSIKVILSKESVQNSRDVLRNLIVTFVANLASNDPQEHHLSIVRSLPVWPRVDRPEHKDLRKYIALEDAKLCADQEMFVSFARDLEQFISPEIVKSWSSVFRTLGVSIMPPLHFWSLIQNQIPNKFPDQDSCIEYRNLVEHMEGKQIPNFMAPAINGFSRRCSPNTLYNHADELFQAAFLKEPEVHFLHPELQRTGFHWRKSGGLRRRKGGSLLEARDFLECANAIDRLRSKSTSAEFAGSASRVTEYLRFENAEMADWPADTWRRISNIAMFSWVEDFEDQPYFRRPRMSELVQGRSHCRLDEATPVGDIRIVWSQLKLLTRPPAASVFNFRPQGGRPTVAVVYEHLLYLITLIQSLDNSEVSEYLEDVKACYDFLQANHIATSKVTNIANARIWLNLPTTSTDSILKDQLAQNLLPAKDLCLNAPDDVGHVKVARNFLIPYEKLLKTLGCPSVVQPQEIEIPSVKEERSPLENMASELNALRGKGELCDITIEVKTQHFEAHRVVLAAASEYCKGQFSGNWGQTLSTNAVVEIKDLTPTAVSTLIDFAYTGVINFPPVDAKTDLKEVADILDDTLDLLIASDRWLMPRLHDKAEVYLVSQGRAKFFIRPENVIPVMKCAETARATRLVQRCKAFWDQNKEFVEAFKPVE